MAFYINFCFKNLIYDDDFYLGTFSASDNDVICEFEYNRHTSSSGYGTIISPLMK